MRGIVINAQTLGNLLRGKRGNERGVHRFRLPFSRLIDACSLPQLHVNQET